MKKIILLFVLVLLAMNVVVAQRSINWSGVLKNSVGDPLVSTSVTTKVGMYSGGGTATLLYEEEHTATTNGYGFLSLKLGEGTVLSGMYSNLDWTQNIRVKIEVNSGSGYETVTYDYMNAVPYSKGSELAHEFKKDEHQIFVDNIYGNFVFAVDGISKMNITEDGAIFSAALVGADTADLKVTEYGEIIRVPNTTRYLSMTPASFMPESSDVEYEYTPLNGLKATTSWAVFKAPIHLPDGAKISSITCQYNDGSFFNDLIINLQELEQGSTSATTISNTFLPTSNTVHTITLASPAVIDNNKAYYIECTAANWANLALRFVKIAYTLH